MIYLPQNPSKRPRSRTIAALAAFAALTVALNLSPIKIPAPYAPFLIYQIWEIPIVAALLLYGLRLASAVAVVNTMVLLAVFPGPNPTGPFYNLAADLSMLLGIFIIMRLVGWQQSVKVIALSTAFGAVMRVSVMTVINYTFLRYPPPIGYSIPVEALVAMLPILGFFNATLALYTTPAAHLVAMAVSRAEIVKGIRIR